MTLRQAGRMITRMGLYGIGLGAIAGFLVGATLLLTQGDLTVSEIIASIFGVLVLSAIYGGMFGGIYGGFSGIFSGGAMALVTALAFREIRNEKFYRYAMGAVTTVMTTGVFAWGGLWSLGFMDSLAWGAAMVMSVVIAVYASQMTAKKYLRERDVRKQKVKA